MMMMNYDDYDDDYGSWPPQVVDTEAELGKT